jgi:hypothetical protein
LKFALNAVDNRKRRSDLQAYIERELLHPDGGFCCRSCELICRPSADTEDRRLITGEMPSVGPYYSLTDSHGRAVRVVVMGQERGVTKAIGAAQGPGQRGDSSVSVCARTRIIQQYRDPRRRNPNSHINGTVCGLVALFRGTALAGRETIEVEGTQVHVLKAFVLTNSTLCSAVDTETRAGPPRI